MATSKKMKSPAPVRAKASPRSAPREMAAARAKPAQSAAKGMTGTVAFRKRLIQLREDILELVRDRQAVEVSEGEVGDEADAASQTSERELAFELSDTERQTLDAVEAALRKIETGRYGLCETCQKKISQPRLQAIPQARNCIECQARFEAPRR